MLEQFKFHIYGIFTFYAAADNSSDEAAVTLDTMNIKEFTAFANDAEIVGANKLSYIAVRTIFAYVQQDLDIAEDSFADKAQQDSGVVEDEDNEMVLREFMEGCTPHEKSKNLCKIDNMLWTKISHKLF